jgi:hypothetical protein
MTEALAPGSSNIQLLLRYRILKTQPACTGTWPASPRWILGHKFQAQIGSRCWNRILFAWCKLACKLELSPPRNYEEVLNTHLLYSSYFFGFNFGTLPQQAAELSMKGLSTIKNIWSTSQDRFKSWPEIRDFFII